MPVSLGTCNRLVLEIEARAKAFKSARLETPRPVVLVDGLWLKLAVPTGEWQLDSMDRRRAVRRKQKRVMLTALGVYDDGHWEILTWQLADAEDAAATELVISDGAKGLAKKLPSSG